MLEGYTMSRHLKEDRVERLTTIATTIGFGEVIKETKHRTQTSLLTNTGVIYIVDKKEKYIITVYVATLEELVAIYKGKRVPQKLYNQVKKNTKIHWG